MEHADCEFERRSIGGTLEFSWPLALANNVSLPYVSLSGPAMMNGAARVRGGGNVNCLSANATAQVLLRIRIGRCPRTRRHDRECGF